MTFWATTDTLSAAASGPQLTTATSTLAVNSVLPGLQLLLIAGQPLCKLASQATAVADHQLLKHLAVVGVHTALAWLYCHPSYPSPLLISELCWSYQA